MTAKGTDPELFEPTEYLIALGNFVARFADLEGLLNMTVWKFSALNTRDGEVENETE
jgi:hypothetical protein